MQPITWNKRTGNLVSGHQRLACIDAIEGGDDYKLDVAVVDLSEADEKAQVVFMNNQDAMGFWDTELLDQLLHELPDVSHAGFDDTTLQVLLDSPDFAPMFQEKENEATESAELIAEMKEAKKEYRQEQAKRDDTEFYLVVVFKDRQAQTKFCVDLGFDPNSKYVDGARLKEKMNSDKASIALETLRPSVQGRVEEPGESETE